jgi:hypothetical protein
VVVFPEPLVPTAAITKTVLGHAPLRELIGFGSNKQHDIFSASFQESFFGNG